MNRFLLCVLAPLTLAGAVQAADYKVGGIEVSEAWSRPAIAGGTGVGFMTLANTGKAADALVAVESQASRKVEIHRSMAAGGVMSMQKQASLALPAGGGATLAPGGYHLMFVGLGKALKAGDAVPATLVFASGARLKVTFTVRALGAAPPMAGHDMSKM